MTEDSFVWNSRGIVIAAVFSELDFYFGHYLPWVEVSIMLSLGLRWVLSNKLGYKQDGQPTGLFPLVPLWLPLQRNIVAMMSCPFQ